MEHLLNRYKEYQRKPKVSLNHTPLIPAIQSGDAVYAETHHNNY